MSGAALLELFDEYASEMIRRQDESWQSPSPEAFHQLRVYIKRMRALLGLVEELSKKKAVRRSRKVFRDVFQAAGGVRDLHVQIDLVRAIEEKHGCDVSWYREALGTREQDAIEAFLCRHDAMLTLEQIGAVRMTARKALSGRSSVELAALAWRHFETRVENTLAFDVESKDLHNLRKRTKEASNLTWILERIFPEVVLDDRLKDTLDDLQNQLGKWHDFDVAIAWEENLSPDTIPAGCRDSWDRFVHALRQRRGVCRAKVMRRWMRLAELRNADRPPEPTNKSTPVASSRSSEHGPHQSDNCDAEPGT